MVISPPRALMLIICITCATFADSYVITKDNHTTADDDYDYVDDPFTVHHVDEVENVHDGIRLFFRILSILISFTRSLTHT